MSPPWSRAGASASLAAVALAMLLPAVAAAEGRPCLAFGPLRKGRPALVRQLRQAVCATAECVPWGTVADGRSFHVARARAAGIAGILVGSVEPSGGRATLTLLLFVDGRRPSARWRLPLSRQGLASPRDVRDLVASLGRHLGTAPREPPAPAPSAADDVPRAASPAAPAIDRTAAAPSPASAEPRPSPAEPPPAGPALAPPVPAAAPIAALPLPVPSPPRLVEPSDADAGEDEPERSVMRLPAMTFSGADRDTARTTASRAAPDAGGDLPIPPWLAVEAGVVLARSDLTFQGAAASPGPLRGHDVPVLAAPRLGLELQPGAWFTDGALSGVSLQGRFAMAVGTRTEVAGTSHATSMSWLSAGVAWRSAPPLGPRTSVSAAASWERREVTESPPVPGLADRRLSGAKGYLGVSQPLGRLTSVFAGVGYVAWLEAPDLIAGRTPFFPSGTAWGLEADAGVAVRVARAWWIRIGAEYASTRYRFARDPDGIYLARAARDQLLAGHASIRFELE